MRMVPNSPYDTGSQAEKLIFDRLRRAFDDRYVAYHSLKPTRHPSKRFPEIDFVICGPDGLYVLEVKGGRLACHEGVWEYQDRYGRTYRSQESAFRQAETALHGLMQDLSADFPADALARLVTGYGVVFPGLRMAKPRRRVGPGNACRQAPQPATWKVGCATSSSTGKGDKEVGERSMTAY